MDKSSLKCIIDAFLTIRIQVRIFKHLLFLNSSTELIRWEKILLIMEVLAKHTEWVITLSPILVVGVIISYLIIHLKPFAKGTYNVGSKQRIESRKYTWEKGIVSVLARKSSMVMTELNSLGFWEAEKRKPGMLYQQKWGGMQVPQRKQRFSKKWALKYYFFL